MSLQEKTVNWIIEGFVYSALLRSMLESIVDLGICCLMDVKYFIIAI